MNSVKNLRMKMHCLFFQQELSKVFFECQNISFSGMQGTSFLPADKRALPEGKLLPEYFKVSNSNRISTIWVNIINKTNL